jgi:hypothetical protein
MRRGTKKMRRSVSELGRFMGTRRRGRSPLMAIAAADSL